MSRHTNQPNANSVVYDSEVWLDIERASDGTIELTRHYMGSGGVLFDHHINVINLEDRAGEVVNRIMKLLDEDG